MSGVRVTGSGVVGQRLPAGAVLYPYLDHIEEPGVSLPAPADEHLTDAEFERELRLEGGKIRPALRRSLDAQHLADGVGEDRGIASAVDDPAVP